MCACLCAYGCVKGKCTKWLVPLLNPWEVCFLATNLRFYLLAEQSNINKQSNNTFGELLVLVGSKGQVNPLRNSVTPTGETVGAL